MYSLGLLPRAARLGGRLFLYAVAEMEQGGQAHLRLFALWAAKQNRAGLSRLALKAPFISTVDRPARFCYRPTNRKLVVLLNQFQSSFIQWIKFTTAVSAFFVRLFDC